MEKKVTTVRGKVPWKELGITDAHNHLWITGQEVGAENPPVLDHENLIEKELIAYRQAGGGAQVDCQPGGAGRDGNHLLALSEKSGIHVIACTGFHLREYYPADYKIWNMNSDQAADHLLAEVEEGLEETRQHQVVYPGFIKIAVRESLEQSPKELLEAACQASRQSGLLIEMHTERGADIENVIDYFARLGLKPERLVLCHLDKRPDIGLHAELAQAGYLLEYDTFFRPKYDPEKNLWPLIKGMVAKGFSSSVALATDLADSEMWAYQGGGPGLKGLIDLIKSRLDKEIQDPKIVDQLLGSNITQRLAI